jgi:uncharacterized protein YecE (DUF72 family)
VYPADLSKQDWLTAYARRFDTVELNNSFYRLPSATQFARWREQVPPNFQFAVKASRFLTHFKRLADPDEPIERLLSRAAHLGPALGPILYQLPPNWVPDLQRFKEFVARLPTRIPGLRQPLRHVIEFRDLRGYSPPYLSLMDQHDVSLCVHDMPSSASPRVIVGSAVYLRLHGYDAKYGGSYPDHVLVDWASWLDDARATGRVGWVYFNNDAHGHAVHNAERLRELLSFPGSRVPGSQVLGSGF